MVKAFFGGAILFVILLPVLEFVGRAFELQPDQIQFLRIFTGVFILAQYVIPTWEANRLSRYVQRRAEEVQREQSQEAERGESVQQDNGHDSHS